MPETYEFFWRVLFVDGALVEYGTHIHALTEWRPGFTPSTYSPLNGQEYADIVFTNMDLPYDIWPDLTDGQSDSLCRAAVGRCEVTCYDNGPDGEYDEDYKITVDQQMDFKGDEPWLEYYRQDRKMREVSGGGN